MFDQIRKLSEPLMKAYTGDLDIDEQCIRERPGTPFLHFTRATGTTIVFLYQYDKLPSKNEKIPHLFGHIDREAMVDNIISMSKYYTNECNAKCLLTQYFDGDKVRKINVIKAAQIGLEHGMRLREKFRRELHEQHVARTDQREPCVWTQC